MLNKDSYIFIGLFLVLFAGFGLLASIIYELNIPLSIIVGALVGIIIGGVIDYMKTKRA